jgi:hypothetical protein
MEFETLRRTSNNTSTTNYNSRMNFGDSNYQAEHSREMISDTAPFGFVAVGQIPNTVVPNNTSSETDGASVFRSTTPSHNSSLNHELSSETIENRHTAIEGLHARAGEDTNVHEKPSSNLAQTPPFPSRPLGSPCRIQARSRGVSAK